jgi:hypothetical protein
MFTDDSDELDLFLEASEFASSITLDPGGASEKDILGIVDQGYADALDIEGTVPMFQAKTSDLAGYSGGDSVKVDGISFAIISIQQDGTGFSMVYLRAV